MNGTLGGKVVVATTGTSNGLGVQDAGIAIRTGVNEILFRPTTPEL